MEEGGGPGRLRRDGKVACWGRQGAGGRHGLVWVRRTVGFALRTLGKCRCWANRTRLAQPATCVLETALPRRVCQSLASSRSAASGSIRARELQRRHRRRLECSAGPRRLLLVVERHPERRHQLDSRRGQGRGVCIPGLAEWPTRDPGWRPQVLPGWKARDE